MTTPTPTHVPRHRRHRPARSAAILCLLTLPALALPTRILAETTVLDGVTLIDGIHDDALPHRAVVVRDGRIAAIEPAGHRPAVPGARIVDLGGHYLLPGFIDTHAHVCVQLLDDTGRLTPTCDEAASTSVLGTLLAFGITTVRNPGAPTDAGVALRERVASGTLAGPQILTSGNILNRTAARFGPFAGVRTSRAIREEIAAQKRAGVDFVKIYAAFTPELTRMAIEAAHAAGLPVLGHLQNTSWTDAADLGIDGITHGAPWTGVYLPEALRDGYRPSMKGRLYWLENLDLESPQITAMARRLAAKRIVVDPTLIVYHTKFWGDDRRWTDHPEQHRVPAPVRRMWRAGTFTSDWTSDDYARAKRVWPTLLALTKLLYDHGVVLAVGSDVPNPWVIPGVGFHEEMAFLEAAGLPRHAVLRAATAHGATALGLTDVGTVAIGQRADLVVLRADPLAAIANTREIAWVMQGGHLIRPSTLRTSTPHPSTRRPSTRRPSTDHPSPR